MTNPPPASQSLRRRQGAAIRATIWMIVIGACFGVGVGLFGSAVLTATGITSASLPPLKTTEAAPEPTPTVEPEPEPTTQGSKPAKPKPEISTDSKKIPPGQKFTLRGKIPSASAGATLTVQVRDSDDEDWDDFPVTTPAKDGGAFETIVYTSRTGERQFRVTDKGASKSTPTLKVTIG